MSVKAILKQYEALKQNPLEGISVEPSNNIYKWNGILIGPKNTPYEDGKFHFSVIFPENYPFKHPEVEILTPAYHPNVRDGKMILCCSCYRGFFQDWSPAITIRVVLEVVMEEFKQPNSVGLCLDHFEQGREFLNNKFEWQQMARFYTAEYAKF